MKNKVILPLMNIPPDVVELYWQTLYMENTLRFRLCDIIDPTFADVKNMIQRLGKQMYMIVDMETKQAVGEFMLEGFTGKAAQVHFSMHPKNTFKESIQLGTWCNDTVLATWTHPEDGSPYLQTLYGLTPVTNRAACIFTLKTGYKKIGILPNGMRDRGEIVDAQIAIRTGEA